MRSARTNLALAVFAAFATLSAGGARIAAAQGYPARFQLSLEPFAASSVIGIPINVNGIQIISPERGNTLVAFGLGGDFGILATPLLEPGLSLNFLIVSPGGNQSTFTDFGFVPFLKLNLWTGPHVNPFAQPFVGFTILSEGQSATFFDGGIYTGVEMLVTNWGFRIWTGFEALIGTPPGANESTHFISIPIRWAFTVYF
jgi:hypothetical protein